MGEEADKLDSAIHHFESRKNLFRSAKERIKELEESGDVHVDASPDSKEITVLTHQDEPTGPLRSLFDLSDGMNRIEYIHENDQYRLKAKFRVE